MMAYRLGNVEDRKWLKFVGIEVVVREKKS